MNNLCDLNANEQIQWATLEAVKGNDIRFIHPWCGSFKSEPHRIVQNPRNHKEGHLLASIGSR